MNRKIALSVLVLILCVVSAIILYQVSQNQFVSHQFTPNRNKIIIVPIEFNDVKFSNFSNDISLFMEKLISDNDHYGSVANYYQEVSYGKLLLNFTAIYQNINGSLGPFQLNTNSTTFSYDSPNPTNSSDPSDYTDGGYKLLITSILDKILPLVNSNSSELNGLTFLPDQNTMFILLHPTQPQEVSKNSSDFWSKASFNVNFGNYGSIGIALLSYNSSSGTIIHELGHTLGLPDLYEVKNAYDWKFSPMCCPFDLPNTPDFLTMEKLWLGWVSSDETLLVYKNTTFDDVYLYPSNWVGMIRNKSMKIPIDDKSYYLIEFRNDVNYFNTLFIYLVDEGKMANIESQRVLGKDIIKLFYIVPLSYLGWERQYYDVEKTLVLIQSSEKVYFIDYDHGIKFIISYRDNCAFIDHAQNMWT